MNNARITLQSLFILQTMGGTFSGKQQDCTKGIYALSGYLKVYFGQLFHELLLLNPNSQVSSNLFLCLFLYFKLTTFSN